VEKPVTSKIDLISNFMREKLSYLQQHSKMSSTKAALANMRRGVGKIPGDIPALWGMLFENLDDSMMSRNAEKGPSWEEWSLYISLTIFAVHQQGKDLEKEFMHKPGETIGKAIQKLVKDEESENRVLRRFNVLATSVGMQEIQHHLRGIVQLLNTNSLPLDYIQLACDIYKWQTPDGPQKVRLIWGQDYYSSIKKENDDKSSQTKELTHD